MSKTFALIMFVGMLAMIGCEAKKEEKSVVASSVAPTISPAALSLMEEADSLDGAKDHVIGKCYVCALGMDGSDKYAVKTNGYTAHLCSKSCQQEFEKSTEEIVLQTKMPKGK